MGLQDMVDRLWGTYATTMTCKNCGTLNQVRIPKGLKKDQFNGICSKCGCEMNE